MTGQGAPPNGTTTWSHPETRLLWADTQNRLTGQDCFGPEPRPCLTYTHRTSLGSSVNQRPVNSFPLMHVYHHKGSPLHAPLSRLLLNIRPSFSAFVELICFIFRLFSYTSRYIAIYRHCERWLLSSLRFQGVFAVCFSSLRLADFK